MLRSSFLIIWASILSYVSLCLGAVLGLMGALENICEMLSAAVLESIYACTVGVFSGTVFIVITTLCVLAAFIIM